MGSPRALGGPHGLGKGPGRLKNGGVQKGSLLRGPSWRALGLSDGFGKGRSGRWEGPEKIQQRLPQGPPKKPKRNKIKYFILFRFYLTAKTDRFLMVSKEQQMTPQGGLGRCRGGCREVPGSSGRVRRGCRAGAGDRRYYGEHSSGSTFLASEPPGTMGNTARGALFRFLMRQVLWGTQHWEHFSGF